MSRGFRITTFSAFNAEGDDGDEGLVAELVGGYWLPYIAADERRVEQLRSRVQAIADRRYQRITLVRFVRGQVLETYDGRKP
jgi:hypothetical protein